MFRAERNPRGRAKAAATAVPSSAISTVVRAPPSAAGSTRGSGGIVRRAKSRIHGSPWTRRTGSAPVSQTSHRSEEHTSELQSQSNLVCRLLLEKKKKKKKENT